MYNDTNCAYACKSNFFTEEQWSRKLAATQSFGCTGFVLSSAFLLLWLLDRERRRQYLVITIGVFTWFSSLGEVVTAGLSYERKFCESPAIPLDMTTSASPCTVQGSLLQLGSLGSAVAWLTLSLDLYFKIVLEKNTSSTGWMVGFMTLNLSIPLAATFLLIGLKAFGYNYGYGYCFFNSAAPFYVYYITIGAPLVLIAVIGILAMIAVFVKIVRSTIKVRRGSSSEEQKIFRDLILSLKVPVLFCSLFLVLSLSVIILLIDISLKRDSVVGPAIKEFDQCVFKHWDSLLGDRSWQSACGKKVAKTYRSNMWLLFCVTGQSIFISLIFLPFALSRWPSDVRRLLDYYGLASKQSKDILKSQRVYTTISASSKVDGELSLSKTCETTEAAVSAANTHPGGEGVIDL